MIDKYNFVFVYPSEFQSKGVLADSVVKYTAFGVFCFQLSMCGLFTSIFGKDFVIASTILVGGEIFYMMVFRLFNINELKEAMRECLLQKGLARDESDWKPRLSLLKTSYYMSDIGKGQSQQEITAKHRKILSETYLHPYEKYRKEENAKR